jgi:hypothetical protein
LDILIEYVKFDYVKPIINRQIKQTIKGDFSEIIKIEVWVR